MARKRRKRKKPAKPITVRPCEEIVGIVTDKRVVRQLPEGVEWVVRKRR